MSKTPAAKQCEIFTRTRKTSTKTATAHTSPVSTTATEASSMVDIGDVLTELKSLRSDFGLKLDNIDNRLSGVANSIVAIENKLSDVERDVSVNTKRIGEAESRVALAVSSNILKLHQPQPQNASPILNRKPKTWKTEAEERI